MRKELLWIGRNVNQAVHAMNAANLPGSTLSETRRVVSRSVGAEVGYWASAYERSKA